MATTSGSDTSESRAQDTGYKKAIADIVTGTFTPFDHQAELVTPFDNETRRDTEFLESGYMLSIRYFQPL